MVGITGSLLHRPEPSRQQSPTCLLSTYSPKVGGREFLRPRQSSPISLLLQAGVSGSKPFPEPHYPNACLQSMTPQPSATWVSLMQCALTARPTQGEAFTVTLKTTESLYPCPVGWDLNTLLWGRVGHLGWG